MTLNDVRRPAQYALVAVAVVAGLLAGWRFYVSRSTGEYQGPRILTTPGSGPVGMRPFLELAGFEEDAELQVFLCPPEDEAPQATAGTGSTEGCVELGRGKAGDRIRSEPIPAALPGGDVVPQTYLLRVGPDPEGGGFPSRGQFAVVPFTIGPAPGAVSIADLDLSALRFDAPREVARGGTCRPSFVPDGRLVVGSILLEPATGVTVDLAVEAAELAWSPERDKLAILTADRKEIRMAAPDASDPTTVVREARGLISSLSWAHDGSRLAYVARSEPGVRGGPGAPTVFVLNLITGETTSAGGGVAVAWSPAEERIAVETADGRIEFSDPAGARAPFTDGGDPAWTPDGAAVVFLRGPEVGEVWAAKAADPGRSIRLVEGAICGAAISPSGLALASVSGEGEARTLQLRRIVLPPTPSPAQGMSSEG